MNQSKREINTAVRSWYGRTGGMQFLRDAVRYLDSRPETRNEGKTPLRLLGEFAKFKNKQ